VERVAREEQSLCQGRGPAGADELQVALRGGAVDFVPDDRVAGMREVDADLVGAAGDWFGGEQREPVPVALKF